MGGPRSEVLGGEGRRRRPSGDMSGGGGSVPEALRSHFPGFADPQCTTSTGSFVCLRTSSVSLPRKSEARPLRPCEPMTIRSQPFFCA